MGGPCSYAGGVRATRGSQMPFHLDDLKLALQYDLVRRIVTADDQVEDAEDAYLARLCPPETLRAAGFQDDHWQPTARLAEAVAEARRVLPGLPREDKRVLMDACVNACVVDGALHARETVELQRAATVLGLSDDDLDAILDSHPAVGVIVLDDPVDE